VLRIAVIALVAMSLVGCQAAPPDTAPPGTFETAAPSPSANAAASEPAASTSPIPTSTMAPTAEPTTNPQPGPELEYPAELGFANQMAMRVIVSGLNVRARPSTSGAKIGKAPKGAVFLFLDYPVKANGFRWYFGYQALIKPGDGLPELPEAISAGIDPLAGWVAAGTSDSPYLRPIPARCPTQVDLANVEAMLDSERITCFGSDPISLTGTFGCGECGGVAAGDYEPDWLTYPLSYGFLSIQPELRIGPFGMRFPPNGSGRPPDGTIINVRGHFADPLSSTCKVAPLGETEPEPIKSSVAHAYCRAQFVVDDYDIVGPNPSFPS
jgi:hypothetical protein